MIYKCTFIRSFTFLSLFYFSFTNSQKAGVFLPIRAGFSAKDAGFLSFYAYLSKSNKRESKTNPARIEIDSRLVWLAFFYYIPTIP
jgi:hypothetical protein